MRVAAVAFVLIVGAAVVLAFANTLNSGVLGGLLGGLAAILLCIPISLAIFTWLTRRQEARQRAAQALEAEEHFADEAYENDLMVYEAEGYVLPMEEEEDVLPDPRGPYLPASRRMPVSGYLPLPPVEQEYDYYGEDDSETLVRRSPRNYPRQPRYPARSLAREEIVPAPPTQGSTRHPATHSLSQHQSAALRKARQEAQQQQRPQRRSGSSSLSRRPQRGRPSSQRPRTSHSLHAREDTSDLYPSEDEYETYRSRQQSSWEEEEDFASSLSTEELREGYQQYPRRAAYPRNPRNPRTLRPRSDDPWTGELDDEDELDGRTRSRRPRRDADRTSKDLRSPLVRRAPYLYDDDPLNEEFTRQLDNDHPITRRSTRIERYRQED